MYSIKQAAELTGVSAHTLRYYEKIGLVPSPKRKNGGVRVYSAGDIEFMKFLGSLKHTGMSLEEISEFVKDGCIVEKFETGENVETSLERRVEILTKHMQNLVRQRQEIDSIIERTEQKIAIYQQMLADGKGAEE